MPNNSLPLPNLGDPNYVGYRSFVVTIKNFEDNESLYNDMENEGGPLHIPGRVVECVNRRSTERNTEYLISYDEAVALTKDPRVLAVELNPKERGAKIIRYGWQSTSDFTKGLENPGTDVNWGLYRTRSKVNTPNWGKDGSNTLPTQTLISDTSGKNVDVVIIDGGIPFPTTLEYLKNSNGTGYSRRVDYNWYGNNNQYYYGNSSNGHQAHTTGTVAGNSQGFARDANIYNMSYNDDVTYVTNFHINKPINPLTGIKNPTVTNNSWGYGAGFSYAEMKGYMSVLYYRGTTYTPTSGDPLNGTAVWSDELIASCRIPKQFGNGFPVRDTATDANFLDSGAAGIINVCSAGNSYFYMDIPGGPDYDNYIILNGYWSGTYYYHRGSSPGAAYDELNPENNPICVGSYGAAQTGEISSNTAAILYGISPFTTTSLLQEDYKSEFSNYGPRVNVYAPGEGIMSVITSTSYYSDTVTDPRVALVSDEDSVNNKLARDAGTSMAGPHVAGVIACILEKNPRMTPVEVQTWIEKISQPTLLNTNGGTNDGTDIGITYNANSGHKILYLPSTRSPEAEVGGFYSTPFPSNTEKFRPNIGQLYPRKNALNSYRNKSSYTISANVSSVVANNTVQIDVEALGVDDGTIIPYIITAKPPTLVSSGIPVDLGVTGIFATGNTTPLIPTFSSAANTGVRIVTNSNSENTITPIANNILGIASLEQIGILDYGDYDDGYAEFQLPWPINFLGNTYNSIFVGTNSYITFGQGSTAFLKNDIIINGIPKICVSSMDNQYDYFYKGVEGSAPNRTYRVRWTGSDILIKFPCIFTYVLVKEKGLFDYSPEMTALRILREYYRNDPSYVDILKKYAKESDNIIQNIQKLENPEIEYDKIYDAALQIQSFIGGNNFEAAHEVSINLYNDFKNRFYKKPEALTDDTRKDWEITFYENNPDQFDIQIGKNGDWSVETISPYGFSVADINTPLKGNLVINNQQASLPISIITSKSYIMNVRLDMFPTPNVTVLLN